MRKKMVSIGVATLIVMGASVPLLAHNDRHQDRRHRDFVTRRGSQLFLDGRPFYFAGSNNYYPIFKSRFMVDDLFETAAANKFSVMRVWGALDIGNADGSNSVDGNGAKENVYFQYWDGAAPAVHDGPDGLERLDYVIASAGDAGLKLVIPFVNNWREFGGMDQYVRWRGGSYHDEFYTDPVIKGWYKNWIRTLLTRVNTVNGLRYKDDPTIMTWELANEPRCGGSGDYPRSAACNTQTIVAWADEMSRFVKSLDRKHLVSVGDEGFYCVANPTHYTENCQEGVDSLALTALPGIDVMSLHLYAQNWGLDQAGSVAWVERHAADARALGKASMLGEVGWPNAPTRNPYFKDITTAVLRSKMNGALYWILSAHQDDGTLYPDYDGYTVYCPSPVCTAWTNFSKMIRTRIAFPFAPVADHDPFSTNFETPVVVNPGANDVTYRNATLDPASFDLDAATPGQQTAFAAAGGTLELQADGSVAFTPAAGFDGTVQTTYTVRDSRGRRSNPATLAVTVRPPAPPFQAIGTFETDTEGWLSANWQTNAGTTSQSADFASGGTYSLRLDTADGGWFGRFFGPPADLSGRTRFKFELQTGSVGTPINVALQLGDGWAWCEGSWGWQNPGTAATIDVDLNALSCGPADLSKLQALYVFLGPGGTFYIDTVRAE